MSDIKNFQKNIVDEFEIFSVDEKDFFNSFFENLKLSKQMKREFSEWLPEIAYAEKCTIVDVLKSSSLADIRDSDKLNGPQKLAKLREQLYNRRYPELSKIKEDWLKLIREVNLHKSRVQFRSDPYFEKSEIELKITAESTMELKTILNDLLKIEDDKWNKIIDPFEGVK